MNKFVNKKKPLNKHSLRVFLRNQLLLLTGFIVVGFSGLMFYLYVDALDIATENGLHAIGSYYAKLHDQGLLKSNALETDEFSIYIGQENLPMWIIERLGKTSFKNNELVKVFSPGNKQYQTENSKPLILLNAMPIEKNTRQLFAVYHFKRRDEGRTTKKPHIPGSILTATFSVFVVLLIAIALIARRFNQRVLNPLELLTDMAVKVDKETTNLPEKILADKSEIGRVAQALSQSVSRIHAFHCREKEFLQNASHELRTPITVISSALDIIQRRQSSGKLDISDPLQHIRQATTNMTETTAALLWLSREAESGDNNRQAPKNSTAADVETDASNNPLTASVLTSADIRQLLTEQIDNLAYLIDGRDLEIKLVIDTDVNTTLESSLLRIIFANLIRNAFEHTFDGYIHIKVDEYSLEVSDSGIGLAHNIQPLERGHSGQSSFGLGLDIVNRIAIKQGWHFTLNNNADRGCTAKLRW